MKPTLAFLALLFCSTLFGQNVVFSNQDILYPYMNDPSFVGENNRVEATGMYQVSTSKVDRFSQYLFAQFPIYENVSFGFDYFKDKFDYYSFSTVMASTSVKIGLGDSFHYIKLGASGGVDTRKQDRISLNQVFDENSYVNDIHAANTDFIYRAGLHYTRSNFSLGGFYNQIPFQTITLQEGAEDELGYAVDYGYTAYVQYGIVLSSKFKVTPIFRYLSYLDDPIYEGAVRFDVRNLLSASVSYKNDYSINPAVRVRLFNALQLGYSYEKSMGAMNFDDIHAISVSYRFKKQNGEGEPEWMTNAKESIEIVEAIKEPKPKKKKEPKVVEEKVEKETAEKPEAVEANEPKKEVETVVSQEPVIEEAVVETIDALEIEEKTTETIEAVDKVETVVSKESVEEASSERVEEIVEETVKVEAVKTKRTKSDYVFIALSPRYYIVASDFDTIEAAIAFKEGIKEKGHRSFIGKTTTSTKFYIVIDSDSNETRALKRLDDKKSIGIFKEAQLLEVE